MERLASEVRKRRAISKAEGKGQVHASAFDGISETLLIGAKSNLKASLLTLWDRRNHIATPYVRIAKWDKWL